MHHSMLTSRKYQEHFTDMLKSSVNNSPKDFLNIQSGIMPSNYYRVHQHHYQEDFCVFPKMKSKKYQKLWPNTYQGEPFDQASDHTPQMFSLSKRKTGNYAPYKITDQSTNGPKRTAMYPL